MKSVCGCGFSVAWRGSCDAPTVDDEGQFCAKHIEVRCASCGAKATHDCDETGQFVCGAPLCADCKHTVAPDGTNGGIGFNAQRLPDGMRQHCKKSEQRFSPWYTRETANVKLTGTERIG